MTIHLHRFLGWSIACLFGVATSVQGQAPPANAITKIEAVRSTHNPLISFETSASLGNNINGPSVIRVPKWVNNPLGKYYLYFAHHLGKSIRLAYADSPEGPWKIHEPGVLPLERATAFFSHVASPDVHVDDTQHEIRMYFHGPVRDRRKQWTGIALSKDGLHFEPSTTILGNAYFRVFEWQGQHYAIGKDGDSRGGQLYRSNNGLTEFERGPLLLPAMRHAAVVRRGDVLVVFFTQVGDAPERILATTIQLTGDWHQWAPSAPIEVLRPQAPYEGVERPITPSKNGDAIDVQQLRDPCAFEDRGTLYLYYAYGGEMGIAVAKLRMELRRAGP